MSRRPRATGSRLPVAVVVLAVAAVAVFFVFPLLGLVQRASWSNVGGDLGGSDVRTALRLSLQCSLAATAISIVLGIPLAWVLARGQFPGRAVLRALVMLPLVLPPVVGGVALLTAFGRRGLIGQYLYDWFDIRITFTVWGVILAETFVAMPFLVITVDAALRALDTRFEDAARTLGASKWTVMRRVTLPMIWPSVAAGAALTWARALGEFGATITFAGNLRGVTQTMPLAVYLALETNPEAAITLSLVLLAVSITVLVLVGSRVLTSRRTVEPTAVAA